MSETSLRTRLVTLVLSLCMLFVAILGLYLPYRMQAQGISALQHRATSVTVTLAAALTPAIDFDDSQAADQVLQWLTSSGEVRWAVVLRPDGTELASLNRELAPSNLRLSGVTQVVIGETEALAWSPVVVSSGSGGLAVAFSLDTLNADTRASRDAVLGVAALILALGLALSWVLGGVLVAPVVRVTEAARRVADGDLAIERLGLHPAENWRNSSNEAQQLTGAIAAMSGQITGHIEQLKTEQERALSAEQEALDANAAKSAFLANMSHELRTPLNAIIGYSEMLTEEAADLGDDDYLPDLGRIQGAGTHLLGLINDMLDLAKIESGRMELFVEVCDVGAVVREVETTSLPLIEKNANHLVSMIDEDVGLFRTDVTRLRQILFNLVSNAAKFSNEGTITIRVRREHNLLTVAVEDTGIGISQAAIGKLFQPFIQADASTTKKYGGTGLGLTLTRRIAQSMGGDVVVESTLGVGSTFTVTLLEQPPRTPHSESAIRLDDPVDDGPALVVVDDDPAAADVMRRTLSKAGYRVFVASDGETGLELAREVKPVAVLLDVMMPGLDGWQVLSELKEDDEMAGIPVIFVTVVEERARALELGAADFLAKPVDRKRLVRVVERFRPNSQEARLLLVEDDLDLMSLMRRTLEREGWVVISAENGRVALDQLDPSLSLIVLDLMMPEMDGFEFLERLRSDPKYSQVPVVVVTARELTIAERAQLERGVQRILAKGTPLSESLLQDIRAAVVAHARRAPA